LPGELYLGVPNEGILNSLGFWSGRQQGRQYRPAPGVGSQHREEGVGARLPGLGALVTCATTGRGLVFAGGASDRMFRAVDAKTVLWQTKLKTGVIGVPVS